MKIEFEIDHGTLSFLLATFIVFFGFIVTYFIGYPEIFNMGYFLSYAIGVLLTMFTMTWLKEIRK